MANQHTQQEGGTIRERILAFVRAHPECTTHDIQASFALELSQIGMYLTRLRNAGLVECERTKGQRLGRWTAVDEENIDHDKTTQIMRQQWEPCHVRPDPLLAAFYGRA